MIQDVIEPLEGTNSWRSREAKYYAGRWPILSSLLPSFTLQEFRAEGDGASNPYMKSVVRQPRSLFERPVPVATVSNTYQLVQHAAVVERCLEGIAQSGVDPSELKCELGLTELGEWMNVRVYFPSSYDFIRNADDHLALRLECFNSVDGSCRLVVLLGWLRFVCSNGLVIGETKTELRDVHNRHLDIGKIPGIIRRGMALVERDLRRMAAWDKTRVATEKLIPWVDGVLSEAWGKNGACRVLKICATGHDAEVEPFAEGPASEKACKPGIVVPGAPVPAHTLFDVSQALSWVATKRPNVDERLEWQSQIPELIDNLG